MQNKKITIKTKNNLPEELKVKKLLKEALAKYPCPIFTDKIIVEHGAISHAFPVLIFGTRKSSEKDLIKLPAEERSRSNLLIILLQTLIHEQFHWFLQSNMAEKECIEYLKAKYKIALESDLVFKNSRDAYWGHLVVCWNTRNYLKRILSKRKFAFITGLKHVYPLTEKFVADNFEQLRQDLEKFGMVYG